MVFDQLIVTLPNLIRLGSYGYSEDVDGVYSFVDNVLGPNESGYAVLKNIQAGPTTGTATIVQGENTWDCTYLLDDSELPQRYYIAFSCIDDTRGFLDVYEYVPDGEATYYDRYVLSQAKFNDELVYDKLDDTYAQLTFDKPGMNTVDLDAVGEVGAYILQKDIEDLCEKCTETSDTVGDVTTYTFSNTDNEMAVVQTDDGGTVTTTSITITKGFADFVIN